MSTNTPAARAISREIRKAQVDALTAHDQLQFWAGRCDIEASGRAQPRMDAALDRLLELGVGHAAAR